MRRFPAPVSLIAYSYAFGTVFMGIAAIFLVNDTSAWALSWDMNLVAILYNVQTLILKNPLSVRFPSIDFPFRFP